MNKEYLIAHYKRRHPGYKENREEENALKAIHKENTVQEGKTQEDSPGRLNPTKEQLEGMKEIHEKLKTLSEQIAVVTAQKEIAPEKDEKSPEILQAVAEFKTMVSQLKTQIESKQTTEKKNISEPVDVKKSLTMGTTRNEKNSTVMKPVAELKKMEEVVAVNAEKKEVKPPLAQKKLSSHEVVGKIESPAPVVQVVEAKIEDKVYSFDSPTKSVIIKEDQTENAEEQKEIPKMNEEEKAVEIIPHDDGAVLDKHEEDTQQVEKAIEESAKNESRKEGEKVPEVVNRTFSKSPSVYSMERDFEVKTDAGHARTLYDIYIKQIAMSTKIITLM